MGIALAAAIAVLTGAGAAIGIGMATSHASEAIARQPEAKKDIRSTMLIGCALAEATAIYGLLVAIMLIFVADPGSNSVLGAAIAVVTGMGAGIGIGFAIRRACDGIARQPEVKKDIRSTMLIGCALAEAIPILPKESAKSSERRIRYSSSSADI